MTVKELIIQLQKCNPDDIVVLSSDEEGNSYSELFNCNPDEYNYNEEDREIGLRKITEELEKAGYGEEDIMEDGKPCVVLWP